MDESTKNRKWHFRKLKSEVDGAALFAPVGMRLVANKRRYQVRATAPKYSVGVGSALVTAFVRRRLALAVRRPAENPYGSGAAAPAAFFGYFLGGPRK